MCVIRVFARPSGDRTPGRSQSARVSDRHPHAIAKVIATIAYLMQRRPPYHRISDERSSFQSTRPILRRSTVGRTVVPRASVTLVNVVVALVMRGSFGRFGGSVLETEEDKGIWRPASMPTVS